MQSGDPDPRTAYGRFLRGAVPPLPAPATAIAWDDRLRGVAKGLRRSFGQALAADCDLAPEILGVIERDDYAIERLTFQSRPGVRVTANLYRPRRQTAPAAAVLSVHGHWPWARIEPTVQARGIGLARLGYVCLCVDAFGAGERAEAPAPGTYHGGPMGASLWAAGVPLVGLQVHDNRRAVDYLVSRSEVDPNRLAITGASGGGNQTLYAGALDDRLKAVVPVCGIGTYEAYLQAACCVCEVLPGGLTFARTSDLLAMIAPRALLVVSASQDAPQFSAKEAAVSLAVAKGRFDLLNAGDRLRHVVVDSGHDYNQPMREAMYGWLDRWLRDRGDGSPVTEPEIATEDPARLRCYPDASSRPTSIVAIPAFAHREALARVESLPAVPDHREAWEAESAFLKGELDELLGGLPMQPPPPARLRFNPAQRLWTLEIEPEPGLSLRGYLLAGDGPPENGLWIVGDENELTAESALARGRKWVESGRSVCCVELRALGRLKPQTSAVAKAVDHNEAEWGIWVGRPLLGQWVYDLLQWIAALTELAGSPLEGVYRRAPITLYGEGVVGTAAMLASAFAPTVTAVEAVRAPVRLVGPKPSPWSGVRMGMIVPNLLTLGDFGRLASLAAPRLLTVSEGISEDGRPLSLKELQAAFAHARGVYKLHEAETSLRLFGGG